jgi:hypothetical protein
MCAMCIVLALLPPVHEHFSHRYTSDIRHVDRSCCCLVESTAQTTQHDRRIHDIGLYRNSYEPG